jgi:ubiquinone/menaquinone biosynthesis C-methylase UbiE
MIAGMERYVIRGGRAGYERLQLLARVHWPATAELLERAGVSPGMHCLDLGCGGGDVTFELGRLVGPDGRVTGIDMDEVKLALARGSAAQQRLANVQFRVANVNDWNEPDRYEVVYCRLLLEHLSRPVDLLRRMWDAVRPGGVIVVEDADFDGLFCDPPNLGFDVYARSYPSLLERGGGDAAIGRKLHRYFCEAGIPSPNLHLTQVVNYTGEAKSLALSTLEATADAMVAEGLSTDVEVRAALASLAAFTDDPATIVGEPRVFQLWSQRPSG